MCLKPLYTFKNRSILSYFSVWNEVRHCCCCSVAKSCPTLCHSMDCCTPGSSVLHYLLEFSQIQVPLSWWWCVAISPSVSSLCFCPYFSQHQGLFQWVSTSHQVAKVLELHFSISPSKEYSGLISFRTDWFDLLVVQGTLKSLLQHQNSKASS